MERESFSNPAIAELMNREFVNIKLDREERPDLDEIYMTATQILTEQGGWPNSVFLTPDLKPFYAGTYFPPENRYGRPGFRQVLEDLAHAWTHAAGRRRGAGGGDGAGDGPSPGGALLAFGREPPPGTVALRALESLARRFDPQWGGFGGAPKFPTPSNLFLLLELAARAPRGAGPTMLAASLDQMARGGIYDQLGGGFHRYATDREWKIPHFEKMLYDNGFLLELYAREHARTGDPQAARIVRETAAWLAREMTSPEGAFWSAIDAETHGHEGAFYVWSREELDGGAGRGGLRPSSRRCSASPGRRSSRGATTSSTSPSGSTRRPAAGGCRWRSCCASSTPARGKLFAARAQRERPATDDKVLTDWNGTVIAGLAVAGKLLGEPAMVEQAARAADFILGTMRPEGGPLLHAWRAGQGKIAAYLADYVFLVRGLLALHERHRRGALARRRRRAHRRAGRAAARSRTGGFFTGAASPDVLFRSKDVFDGAMPVGQRGRGLEPDRSRRCARAISAGERARGPPSTAFAEIVQNAPRRRAHAGARRPPLPRDRRRPRGGERRVRRRAGRPRARGLGRQRGPAGARGGAAGRGRISTFERRADGWRPFRLTLEIAPGLAPAGEPRARSPTWSRRRSGRRGAELRNIAVSGGEPLRRPATRKEAIAVYSGRTEITGEVSGAGKLVLDVSSLRRGAVSAAGDWWRRKISVGAARRPRAHSPPSSPTALPPIPGEEGSSKVKQRGVFPGRVKPS